MSNYFEKVSRGRFVADGGDESAYDGIKLPVRATAAARAMISSRPPIFRSPRAVR